ncbi:V-type ATP synthase subunit I [Methanobrevibacter cuticularis]|uniref:A-type ATP synthase subunit I n=2 Tax=Methanobrevibacter cuticularis TaxID=47311 RepID=A0A166DRR4_9EURY|nr:V-type ATP synthase subunit I [Methanobrevibacter cuticularis]
MRKLRIISLDQYSNSIVQSLHEEGIVQINDISERIQQNPEWANLLKPSKTPPLTGKLSSLLMKTTGLSELLGDTLSGETSIKDMIKSFISPDIPEKIEVEDIDGESLIVKAEDLLHKVESQTKVIEDQLNALSSRKSELRSNESLARELSNFDIDLALLNDSNYTSTIVGRMDVESSEKFKKESVNITDKLLILETTDDDKINVIIIVVMLKEFKEDIYSLLRKFEFEKFETEGIEGKPTEIINSAEAELKSIEGKEAQLSNDLKEVAEKWDNDIIVLKEQLEIEKERNEIFSTFGETEKTIMLEAWVPLKKVNEAQDIIESSSDGHSVVEVEDVGEDDLEVPVLQDNPKLVKPYEFLVNMYAPLRYNEVDPTILVFLIFPFFFGFCLTESVYGLVFAIIGVVLYRGIGKINATFKSMGAILIGSGLWAIILGLLTGGFIGDFFPRFLGFSLPTGLIDPFKSPEIILIIALIVGLVHLNMGFILGVINNFRYDKKKDALGDQLVWFVLEAGIAFLALGFLVPSVGIIGMGIGVALLISTFVILIYCGGVYGIMDIFGFLGNWLSYARLLALCLSTGGIAMTVNILTELLYTMVPIPILAIIIAILMFLFGHVANFVLQVVGAFINSLRLNYVEFFSQFYAGGKNQFEAFNARRVFTRVKK